MTNPIIFIVAFIIWIIVTLSIGIYARIKTPRSFEGYTLGDRKFKWYFITATVLGTYIGGGTLIALAGKIAVGGVVYFFLPFGVFVALILLMRFSRYYRNEGEYE
ncbi:unnamed protein product, partial [marine sediment metagenome]